MADEPWKDYAASASTNEQGPWDDFKQPAVAQAAPAAPKVSPPTRSWGEAVEDTARGVASGIGGLLKTGGQLYGLATGDMDNIATRHGERVQEYWQEGQSEALKADKDARSEAIQQADGMLDKAGTAVWETVKNPRLLVDTIAENATSMVPSALAARVGARVVGQRAVSALTAQGMSREAAEQAARAAAVRAGTAAAVGTGAVQQGADVAGGAYEDAMATDQETLAQNAEYQQRVGAGEDPAQVQHDLALRAARVTFPGAAAVSALTQALPAGATIERAIAGAAAKTGAVSGLAARGLSAAKGAAGEGVQEALEEGGGQAVANLAQQGINPNRSVDEGVGEAAGMGFVGGAALGGVAGAAQRQAQADTVRQQAAEMRATAQGPLTRVAADALDQDANAIEVGMPTAAEQQAMAAAAVQPPRKRDEGGWQRQLNEQAAAPPPAAEETDEDAQPLPPSNLDPVTGESLSIDEPWPAAAEHQQPQRIIEALVLAAKAKKGRQALDGISRIGQVYNVDKATATALRSAARERLVSDAVQQGLEGMRARAGEPSAATEPEVVAAEEPAGDEATSAALEDRAVSAGDEGDIDLEETYRGLEVDRESRENLAAALSQGVDPNTGKPIESDGFRREYETELENLDGAISNAEQFLRARGALDDDGAFVVRPPRAEPAPVAVEPAAQPAPAAAPAAAAPQGESAPGQAAAEGGDLAPSLERASAATQSADTSEQLPLESPVAPGQANLRSEPRAQETLPNAESARSAPGQAYPASAPSAGTGPAAKEAGAIPSPQATPGAGPVQGTAAKITMRRAAARGGDIEVDAVRVADRLAIRNGPGWTAVVGPAEDGTYTASSEVGDSPEDAIRRFDDSRSRTAAVIAEQQAASRRAAEQPTPTLRALQSMADGTHPESAMAGLSDADIREVAAAMGQKVSRKASLTGVIERIGERARGDWIRDARRAMAAAQPPAAPVQRRIATTEAIRAAAERAATSPANDLPQPTEAQKEAGNYQKGHARVAGLDVSIENPAGTRRRPEWPPLKHHYGYFKGTVGKDKDHVDVFLTENAEDESRPVFVVDQNTREGRFDEHKVILGAATEAEARKAYLANYSKGWKGLGAITQMTQEQFKAWVKDPAQTKRRAVKAFAATPAAPAESANEGQEGWSKLSTGQQERQRQDGRATAGGATASAPAGTAGEVDTAAERKRFGLPRVVRKADAVAALRREAGMTKAAAEQAFDDIDRKGLKEGTRYGDDVVAMVLARKAAPGAGAQHAKATAPEHVNANQRGLTVPELREMAQSWRAHIDGGGDAAVTRIFDAPAKGDIFRLNNKAKVYHAEHGWMTPTEAKAKIAEWKEHARAQGKDPRTAVENSQKVVLSLFDLSGEWSKPWREAGYQVWQFDIQDEGTFEDSEGNERKIGDVNNMSVEFFNDLFGDFEGQEIHAVLAACPCTDFAVSGARHFAAKDADGRTVSSVELVQQTLNLIEYFKPAVWAVENPVGRIEQLAGLPPWRLSFDPNHLGDPYTKKTLIWGRFNADLPVAPVEPTEGSKMHRLYGGKSMATKNARSETPEGFSYGFFMANNAADHPIIAVAGKYDRLDRELLQQALDAGLTPGQIDEAIEDPYFQELDDKKAEAALRRALSGAEKQPTKLRNFGWDAVKLADAYSFDELNQLRAEVETKHANLKDDDGHPTDNGRSTIYLYDKEGRRKLDALSWAVTYKLQQSKAEKASIAEQIAAGQAPPQQPAAPVSTVAQAPEPSPPPAPAPPPAPVQMTMAEWKATHRDYKGVVDGQRTIMRGGRLVPVEIVKEQKPAAQAADSTPEAILARQRDLFARLRKGEATLDDYKAGWNALLEQRAAVIEHLGTFKKTELLDLAGPRYKNDRKDMIVRGAIDGLEAQFQLGRGITYMVGGSGSGRANAVQAQVDGTTEADLAAYAKEYSEAKARRAAALAGMDNPQTLDDFIRLTRSLGSESELTTDQRETFDRLRADARREQRDADARRNAEIRRVDTGATGMTLVETKHTQKGHDLFVVRMDERVERDVYDRLNIAAKRLGGHYSSYRGNGAVPGFTFTTREGAEQFMAVREGNVDASAQQQARSEAKAEGRAETLHEKAAAVRERAEASLSRDRKDNTARRARMAASAESTARHELAIASTMDRLADAIDAGTARMLGFVRHRTQVDMLDRLLRDAHWEHLRAQGVQWEKAQDTPLSAAALVNVRLPRFSLSRGDAIRVARRLVKARGGKQLGQSLAKMVDYGEEYGEAVKANPYKFVVAKGKTDGSEQSLAFFAKKREAEAALARSQNPGQFVVVKMPGAGKTSSPGRDWAVALAPDLAIERKLWEPDYDKKVTLNPAGAGKIMDALKVSDRGDSDVPYVWALYRERRAQLAKLGIETDYELREALREFLALRAEPAGEDRVRKLERALAGNKNVGVDFFPTPPAVVQRLVEQADIGAGMRVLEPSAGKGDIADALRAAADNLTVDTVEMSSTLREVLEAKGFDPHTGDFLEFQPEAQYDRIVMNPPFGTDNGAAHVRHAYTMLAPGGRLVAVMGAGTRGKAEFDQWLESVGGLAEALPEGSFKSSFRPTGVATQVVVIDKPSGGGASGSLASRPMRSELSAVEAIKQGKERTNLTLSELAATVGPITAGWNRESRPRVVLLESAKDRRAPDGIEDNEGFYDPATGTVYLVAANIHGGYDRTLKRRVTARERAQMVLAHESIGHFSVEAITGPELWGQIEQTLDKMRASGRHADLFAEIDRRYRGANRSIAMREAVAVMVEKGVKNSVVERLLSAMRRFLRALGFVHSMSEAELRQHLVAAARYVRSGARPRVPTGMVGGEGAFASRPMLDLEKQVQIVEITGGAFGDTNRDLGEARRRAQRYLIRVRDAIRDVRNDDTGWKIGLSAASVRKLTQFDPDKLNLMLALPRISKVAVLAASESPRDLASDSQLRSFHTLYAPVRLDGELRIARLVVREDVNGRYAYDLQQSSVLEKQNPATGAGFSPVEAALDPLNGGGAARQTGRALTVAQIRDYVNAVGRTDWFMSARAATFYSALAEAVGRAKGAPKKGDASSWKGWLDGAQRRGEFRQAERDWIGLDEWLDGRESTTREELAAFVRANEVQVQDVVLGDRNNVEEFAPLPDGWRVESDYATADDAFLDNATFTVYDEEGEVRGEGATRAEAMRDAMDEDAVFDAPDSAGLTKFSAYQLPGGENYRELLLTLPGQSNKPYIAPEELTELPQGYIVTIDDAQPEGRKYSITPPGQMHGRPYGGVRAATPEAARAGALAVLNSERDNNARDSHRDSIANSTYRSSHFDQPNILAHVRFNERTDADGKRVLFLEEIQSDWHQAGRKRGYTNGEPSGEAFERMTEFGPSYGVRWADGSEQVGFQSFADAERAADRGNGEAVPDAPFKATDEWAMLAFKRMAREAAERGFDRIAWTTGEQQAERYDLRKHIKDLTALKRSDGKYLLRARDPAGEPVPGFGSRSFNEQQMADAIGKDLADKIIKGEGGKLDSSTGARTYSGVDLKVGGEGMRAFYDQILPAAVNKWAKRFGGRVGQTGVLNGEFSMRDDDIVSDRITSHSLDITDAMRETVMAGQPLFSRPDRPAVGAGLLFSSPDRQAGVVADIEQIMAAATEQDQSVLERARARLADLTPAKLKEQLRSTWLGALTTRHLTELGADYFGTMPVYSDLLAEMNADRNRMQEQAEGIAEPARKWASKNAVVAKRMFKLMHDATIAGSDPSEPYQPLQFEFGGQLHEATKANVREAMTAIREQMRGRAGDNKKDMIARAKFIRAMPGREKARKAAHPELVARWEELPDEAKDIYRQFRDAYQTQSKNVEDALVARINDTDAPDNQKRKLISVIRYQFESQRLQGVYFPLQRHGRYFVAAEKDDTSTFLMFERQTDLTRAVRDLRDRGFTIKAQGLKSEGKANEAPSGTFVAEVVETMRKAGVSNETQDQVYQLYLQALPEMSMRKHFIHRKSVPGFDPDAVRAFAFNMHHGAHQVARLRYAHKLTDMIAVLKAQQDAARKDPAADTTKIVAGDALLGELDRRHEWILNPTDSQVANLVSSFGFLYYLGITPAAALVNLSQTALISFPYLAARFGWAKASRHLLAAMTASVRTVGHIQTRLTNADERRAHEELQRMGALDKTQAHNLAGIAEGGLKGYNPKWARAMEIIGWGFHKTEVVNREATGIAAYRLAREAGESHERAVRVAADTINDTHYDYTNQNRARFMQSGTAKVLLMFRQYSLNTTWHLGRMVWQATKAEAPEVRALARRNLAGILGMTALFSGAMGLPTMSVVMGVLNALAATFGDDDEPWDARVEFRAFLVDMLGEGAASLIIDGPVNQVTGADIASRVSMSQLWFRDADRELDGRGAYFHLLEQAAGPMGGVLKNVLVGKQMIDEGRYWRGIETMLPKALKDAAKATRYKAEGVNNMRGDPILADPSVYQALLQLNGFTPAEVAEQYETNRALKNYEQHILDRRAALMDALAMAIRLDDRDARESAMEKIQAFNQANPELAINRAAIRRSLLSRARYTAKAENGIFLNPKIAAKVRAAVGEAP